jgi:manganese transport system permease protein
MIFLSTGIGAFCGLGGIYLSFYVDVSSGASVVLFSALLFVVVLLYSNLKGKLSLVTRRADRVASLPQAHANPFE